MELQDATAQLVNLVHKDPVDSLDQMAIPVTPAYQVNQVPKLITFPLIKIP